MKHAQTDAHACAQAITFDEPILFTNTLLDPAMWSFPLLAAQLGEVLVRRKHVRVAVGAVCLTADGGAQGSGAFRYFNVERLLSDQLLFPSLRASKVCGCDRWGGGARWFCDAYTAGL